MVFHSMKRVGRAAGIAAFAALFATQAVTAATPTRVRATTSNPYAGCTIGSGPPEWGTVNYPNAEVEPQEAVNPTNKRNILGVVQQDRWNDGGAHGLVALVSKDGGDTYKVVALPFSSCAAGGLNYERASDPWVSFGPDGTAYAVALSFDENTSRNAVTAATSVNGGKTWANVTEVVTSTSDFHDKETVTADPTTPGRAYIVWDVTSPAADYPAPSLISITTDYGQHWSAPAQMEAADPNSGDIGNELLVNSHTGALYDIFERFFQDGSKSRIMVRRSTDHGATWSASRTIALDNGIADYDPHPGGVYLRTAAQAIPQAAIDPNTGRLYVVWEDARFTGGNLNQAVIATSATGSNWGSPSLVNLTVGKSAFTPTVAVNDRGQVAVTYYDFRHYDPNNPKLPTNYWMRISPAGGRQWGPDIPLLSNPFDMLTAPDAGGLFVGDYEGLTAKGSSFVALYCATTGHPNDATDCYSVKVKAPQVSTAAMPFTPTTLPSTSVDPQPPRSLLRY